MVDNCNLIIKEEKEERFGVTCETLSAAFKLAQFKRKRNKRMTVQQVK